MKKTTSAMLALVIFLMLFASGCADGRPAMTPDWTDYSTLRVKGNAVPVCVDGKWGVMGLDGEYYIEPQFAYINEFTNGVAVAAIDEEDYALIDTKGRVLWRGDYIYYGSSRYRGYPEGIFQVRKGGKWGLVNSDGKYVVEPQYEYLYNRVPTGEIAAQKDGKWGFIDLENNVRVDFRFEDIYKSSFTDVCAVKENGAWGLIDMTGQYLIEPQYEKLWRLEEEKHEWFAAKKDGKWGFIDITGQVKVDFQYDDVVSGGIHKYVVKKNGKSGCICDITGRLLEPIYDLVSYSGSDVFTVKLDGKEGYSYVDWDGNPTDKPTRSSYTTPTEKNAVEADYFYAVLGGKGVFMDTDGNILLELGEYQYVRRLSTEWYVLKKGDVYTLYGGPRGFFNDRFYNNFGKLKNNGQAVEAQSGDSGNSWGIVDRQGNWLVEPIHRQSELYKYWWHCYDGITVVRTGDKYGIQNELGEWLFPQEHGYFSGVRDGDNVFGLFLVTQESESPLERRGIARIFDLKGNVLVELEMTWYDYDETMMYGMPKF